MLRSRAGCVQGIFGKCLSQVPTYFEYSCNIRLPINFTFLDLFLPAAYEYRIFFLQNQVDFKLSLLKFTINKPHVRELTATLTATFSP